MVLEEEEDSQSSSKALIGKPKKKRKKYPHRPPYRPAFMPELRILKRDIRRKYPEMLQNVMNSHDIHLLERFYKHFILPTADLYDCNAPSMVYDEYHWPKQSKGYQRKLEAMAMSFKLFPDSVFYLDDIQISVRLHERGSRIMGKTRSKQTQVVGVKFLSNQGKTSSEEMMENHPPFEVVPLETPMMVELTGRFLLELDECHRIEKAQIIFDHFTFTPLLKSSL